MGNLAEFVGTTPEIEALLRAARMAANTDAPLLLAGESGSGKSLLAHTIHQQSRYCGSSIVPVNCSSIESFTTLFNELKADPHAAKNTLLLEEVTHLNRPAQQELHHLLKGVEYGQPTSGYHAAGVGRIIATTSDNMAQLMAEGSLYKPLYYTLQSTLFEIPPLRQRPGDLLTLIDALTRSLAQRHQLAAVSFSKGAIAQLKRYHWPGNIRQLRGLCERMMILNPGGVIEIDDLPQPFHNSRSDQLPHFRLPEEGIVWRDFEREVMRQALERTAGNHSKAARLLGVTRDTLLYRLRKHALR